MIALSAFDGCGAGANAHVNQATPEREARVLEVQWRPLLNKDNLAVISMLVLEGIYGGSLKVTYEIDISPKAKQSPQKILRVGEGRGDHKKQLCGMNP